MLTAQPHIDSDAHLAEELIATIRNGEWDKIGLTAAEAAQTWNRFVAVLLANHGEQAKGILNYGHPLQTGNRTGDSHEQAGPRVPERQNSGEHGAGGSVGTLTENATPEPTVRSEGTEQPLEVSGQQEVASPKDDALARRKAGQSGALRINLAPAQAWLKDVGPTVQQFAVKDNNGKDVCVGTPEQIKDWLPKQSKKKRKRKVGMLRNQNRRGLDRDLAQTVMALAIDKDWDSLRSFVADYRLPNAHVTLEL